MADTYYVGGKTRSRITCKDVNGAVQDPTTVAMNLRDPSGNISRYVYLTDIAIVRESKGVYYVDITLDQATTEEDLWHDYWKVEGNGVDDAFEGFIKVMPVRAL